MKLLEDLMTQRRRQIYKSLGIPYEFIKGPPLSMPPTIDYKKRTSKIEKYVRDILEANRKTGDSELVFK